MPSSTRDLWLTRLYYLICFGGTGFISPFLNLFFVRLGFSGSRIGWIMASCSVVALVAAPFWTSRNDKWRNPRAVLQVFLILTALSYLWLSQQTLYWGVLGAMLLRTFVYVGVPPLSDSLALSVTRAVKKGFGTVRLWNSAGWIFAGLLSGWLVEQTDARAALILGSVTFFLGALILFPISLQNFSTPPGTTNRSSVIRDMLHNRPMIRLGILVIAVGIANNGVQQFEAVYMDTLGASETVIGIASILGAVVEVPCMLWADRLVSRWGAPRLLRISMMMLVGIRLTVFVIPTIPTILVIKAITGVAFSFYVIAFIGFINNYNPQQQTRTVLALYNVTLPSLLGMIAPPLAGEAYDQLGARWLYAIAAVGYLLGWLSLRTLASQRDREVAD